MNPDYLTPEVNNPWDCFSYHTLNIVILLLNWLSPFSKSFFEKKDQVIVAFPRLAEYLAHKTCMSNEQHQTEGKDRDREKE